VAAAAAVRVHRAMRALSSVIVTFLGAA